MKKLWDDAVSIESFSGDLSDLEEVAQMMSGGRADRVYIFYRDKNGGVWYRTEFVTDSGRLSEYEYIFGKPEKRRPR